MLRSNLSQNGSHVNTISTCFILWLHGNNLYRMQSSKHVIVHIKRIFSTCDKLLGLAVWYEYELQRRARTSAQVRPGMYVFWRWSKSTRVFVSQCGKENVSQLKLELAINILSVTFEQGLKSVSHLLRNSTTYETAYKTLWSTDCKLAVNDYLRFRISFWIYLRN